MEIDSRVEGKVFLGVLKNLKIKIGGLLILGGLTAAIVFFLGFFELPQNSVFSAVNKILAGRPTFATGSNLISIYAAGTPAAGVYPTMRLLVNGVVKKTFTNITGDPYNRIFNQYTYQHTSTLYGKNISVQFTNDATINGQDRNLAVDKIVVGDVTHETETVSTLSTGTFDAVSGCASGYKMSEWLHCNGKFDYHPKDSFCKMFPLDAKCNTNKMNTINWNDSPFMHGDGQSFYFMDITWNLWPMFFGQPVYHTGLIRPGQIPNVFNNWLEKPSWYKATINLDGTWSSPVLIKNDMCCSMTHDHQVFVYQTEVQPGSGDTNIVFAIRYSDGTWSPPQDFGPSINTTSQEGNPYLSFDGSMMVWESNRPGGYGGNDLWISFMLPDGSWAPAQNMGANVNTAGDEEQAWISVDNKRVYFDVGFTLKVTQNLGSGWTTPQTLVFPAPIEVGEASFTYNEQTLAAVVVNRTVEDAIFSISHRQPDGTWSAPVPVD